MRKILFILFVLFQNAVLSQVVEGKVTDENNIPLVGVNVTEKGTSNGTSTDLDGYFRLQVRSLNATLSLSYIGYRDVELSLNGRNYVTVEMQEGLLLGEVQVVGSRSFKRSSTNSPVPVDVIDLSELSIRNGQIEINQILQYVAPSFNASKQSGSDGADHIDPATLRGLGPDQTLVLINGKRRHQSSLINVFGTRGRGNTGTDLNAIPVAAIKRIEVLRDGAAAQYGSDAIAGVINIVLNDQTEEFQGNVTYGLYSTAAQGTFDPGTPNADGKNRLYDKDRALDGQTVRISGNYGIKLSQNGGFINMTTELLSKQRTLRPGADFRKGFGEAAIDGFNFMLNAAVPLTQKTEAYAFGGRNFRDTDAYAFTRNNPTERNVLSIYPDGFTPRITSNITDASVSAGIRHEMSNGWLVDFNNTYGKNNFHYFIKNTLNASLQGASPTSFDAGGHSLSQNTTGLDFTKYFRKVMSGLNVAFGTEYRTENFRIFAGEEGSYATYDVNGIVVTRPDQVIPVDPETGEQRPGGSQGFPGYSPSNAVDRNRTNLSLYADGELNLSNAWMTSLAFRYENYSDFGSTFNYKFATRYKLTDELALRGAFSTGFRAPSLAQIYYNLRFTNFVGGVANEVLLSPNNSPVTRAFGISELRQETAQNASLGVTYASGNFSATVDAYLIDVKNRIVLTDYFDASSLGINVASAQFFANGLDTRTKGLDIVLNYRQPLGKNSLNFALTGNINAIDIQKIHNGALDPDVFFGPREQYFLRASAPDYKFGLLSSFKSDVIDFSLGLTRFSGITLLGWEVFGSDDDYGGFEGAALEASKDVYDPAMVVDFSATWHIAPKLNFTLGANNLLNAYPTQQNPDGTDSGGYWDSVQMGFSGAYYFGRLGFRF